MNRTGQSSSSGSINSSLSSSSSSSASSNSVPSNSSSNSTVANSQGSSLLQASSQSYSDIPMQKFCHLWTIKQFNLIPIELERLCSPWFSPPSSKDLWFLKLRLKAVDENNGNQEFIGVHLFLKESGDKKKEVRAHYTISVLDSMGNKRFTGECSKPEGRIFKAGTEGHGYKLLCPRDAIFRPDNKLLGDENSLNIRCEVTVFGEIRHLPPKPDFFSPFPNELKEAHSLSTHLSKFLYANYAKDVTLICKDTDFRIDAHRAILMARSEVFCAMFDHEMVEKKTNQVILDDIDGDVLAAMVHFMYTDTVPKLAELADSLLVAADRYQLGKLKIMCEEQLLKDIDIDKVGHLLTIADVTNAEELKKACLEFACSYPVDVSNSSEFDKFVSKRPLLYKEAFQIMAKKSRKM